MRRWWSLRQVHELFFFMPPWNSDLAYKIMPREVDDDYFLFEKVRVFEVWCRTFEEDDGKTRERILFFCHHPHRRKCMR
jgi:hypothetical protein